MIEIWILFCYFLLVVSGLALALLPSVRAMALQSWRSGCLQLSQWTRRLQQSGSQTLQQAGGGGRQTAAAASAWLIRHIRQLMAALAVLALLPLVAIAWRHWVAIETFAAGDVRIRDERVASLLAGERLVPPAPLPPQVFTTREVEMARPLVRFASRDWALLDPDFAQRLLVVFRIMREQHGYEMVLIEGYRSPQRQEQLAAMGGHVTKAGAFLSYHQFGLAADSAFMRQGSLVISEQDPWAKRGYELYGHVAASVGMTWGGSWRDLRDYGHVELRRAGVIQRTNPRQQPSLAYEH